MGRIFAHPVLGEDYLGKTSMAQTFLHEQGTIFRACGKWHGVKRHASTLRGFSESLMASAEWVIASPPLGTVISRWGAGLCELLPDWLIKRFLHLPLTWTGYVVTSSAAPSWLSVCLNIPASGSEQLFLGSRE